jgi:hypothetical protein
LLLVQCGCDPTIRATTENGIISLSQSFFGAFLQALVQLGAEAKTTTAQTVRHVVESGLM